MNPAYQQPVVAARAVLLLVLSVAPWWLGARSPEAWFWLFCGVLLSMALWGVATLFDRGRMDTASFLTPVLIPIVFWLVWGVVQLAPLSRTASFAHAVFADWQPAVTVSPWNLDPTAGRLEVCRYFFAAAAFVLGVNLFRTPESRRWLFGSVAINGVALSLFGIFQKSTWNGKLFWTISLPGGGVPFASFINRNNASGFLNLTLACAAGLAVFEARSWQARKTPGAKWPDPGAVPQVPQISLGMGAVIMIAVVVALSRGGLISLVAGITLCVLAASRSLKASGITGILVMVVAVLLGVGWLGFHRALEGRLESLTSGAVLCFHRHHVATASLRHDRVLE